MKTKHVLITGGAGYIAANLSNYLHSGKNIIVSNHVDKLWANKVEDMRNVLEYDVVVHLAAMSGISNCTDDIDGSIRDNILAPLNIFKLAKEQGIPVIFTSSQAAKTPEANLYAMQKRIAEVDTERLNKLGADIKVLRLTNVYGGMYFLKKKNTVVANFVNAVKNKKDLIINGNGEQIRDYIHVNDVCKAIHKCIEYNGKMLEPIDIGTGIGTSVYDLAKMFNHNFVFDEYSKMVGTMKNVANTEIAKKILGFKATIKIEDYIKEQLK